jgi:2',3'-cyclic-nucleotide 2'-phosphodiesterase (5'-nucleotidase family)
VAGLVLDDQEEVVRRWARELDPRTDLLIALTHNGVHGDTLLARELAGAGVDVIVGGHSHTRLTAPLLIGDVLVVQAGAKTTNLGRLDLRVADDRVVEYHGRLIETLVEDRRGTPELAALVDDYARRVDDLYGRTIGELATPWRRTGRGESNVGSWVCDRMLEAAGADVALLNSGTLRKNFEPGPLTLLDVHSLVPFSNTLETFEIDGAGLLRIARFNAEAAEADHHGILQIAGLRYAYTVRDGAVELLESSVGGQPIEPARVYTVACPDYVAQKADLYLDMERPVTRYEGHTITEVVVDAVRAAGRIVSETDGRITRR